MTDSHPTSNLAALRDQLEAHLLEQVMPFWMRHAVDSAGGLNTMIRDDGTVISRDKWMWSQLRALWVFSELHARFGPRDDWRHVADGIYAFATRCGWNEAERGWNLRVTAEGEVQKARESIYTDLFAIYGLTAYARAFSLDEPMTWARRTADAVLDTLERPHDQIPHFPYPVPPGARVHGIPMMASLIFWELGQALDEARYRDAAGALSDEIFERFYDPERDVLLERIGADGGAYPPPLGTAVVPGHVIEDMWFQIHIARERDEGGGRATIERACHLTARHLELGWDPAHGGLLLAVDADGRDTVGWDHADAKLWWPQTEAMYATLLAYEHSHDRAFLDWYDRVHAYSFAHYPVADHGEWRQRLDRFGEPLEQVVALPVKDPFHLPRALIYCIEVLGRLTRRDNL